MNRADLIAALAATPPGGTLVIPAGTHTIDLTAGTIPVHRPLSIIGAGQGATVFDVVPKTQAAQVDLFTIDAPDRSAVRFADLTIAGPTATTLDADHHPTGILWAAMRTAQASLTLERVTITGAFDSGVQRAGGGHLTVIDSTINAWEAPIKMFGSHGETGALQVIGCTLTGFSSKTDSIGIYVHPQFDVLVANTVFDTFGRFGLYANGSPQAQAPAVVVDGCTFRNCDIIQGATGARPLIARCTATAGNGSGSLIKGDATFVDCNLGAEQIVSMTGAAHHVDFLGCTFAPTAQGVIVGGSGRWSFTDCTWSTTLAGQAINTAAEATAQLLFDRCVILDHDTGGHYLVQTQGAASINWGDTRIATNRPAAKLPGSPVDHGVLLSPLTKVTGAPTIVPAT